MPAESGDLARRQFVAFVEGADAWNMCQAEFPENFLHRVDLGIQTRAAGVDHVQEQVGIAEFL